MMLGLGDYFGVVGGFLINRKRDGEIYLYIFLWARRVGVVFKEESRITNANTFRD